MLKKPMLGALFAVIGLSLLTACGTVGSVSPPPPPAANHAAQALCNTPQQPYCRG